ncbi:MAG: prolyl oligopeptidase family serine peptidase [Candidatus Ancillula trichonymphae]|nr:prolyl oligopeptidase family serine peptidase [Candidatus Ancillula trichonymphae]
MEVHQTKKKRTERVYHDDVLIDDYEWLRERDSPEVLEHLERENEYTAAKLQHQEGLRAQILDEIGARTKQTDMSVPERCGSWWYFMRTIEGQSYPISCRVPVEDENSWEVPVYNDEDAQTIFDENQEAERFKGLTGSAFFSVGTTDVSRDGTLLLFSVDTAGNERYNLKLRNLETGVELPDKIQGIAHQALFDITGHYIFYTRTDSAWRTYQVVRHRIGEVDDSNDEVVFQEDDELFSVGVNLSLDRQTIYIECASKETSEIYTISANDPTGSPKLFWKRTKGVEYDLEVVKINGVEYKFVLHNKDSVDFAVDIFTHDDELLGRFLSSTSKNYGPCEIQGVSVFKDYIVACVKRDAINRVYYLLVDDFLKNPLKPEDFWTEIIPNNLELFNLCVQSSEYESPVIRYFHSSYTTPHKLISLNVSTREETLLKQLEVMPNVDDEEYCAENYAEKRLWATSHDGKRIPISLIWRKSGVDDELPQNRAVLQNGYGAYGVSQVPQFSIPRLSMLDRGVVYAVSHVRGGGDLGRAWYLAGNKQQKKNTFLDFVSCSKLLVEKQILNPKLLVISGRSAGGLLIGAAMNMFMQEQVDQKNDAIDLAGVVADVPFVDILTTMLDASLPLTIPEQEEWGDPLPNRDVYNYIKSYAPYNDIVDLRSSNVKPPQILVQTSLNDTHVLFVEPAKWVAKLRELGYNPLLKCEMQSGHAGVSGRYNIWKETAFELAWTLEALGVQHF